MKKSYRKKNGIWLAILLMAAIGIGSFLVFHSYRDYLDELIYQERLNQMTEVTKELYSSMDMLMSNEWGTAQFIRDGMSSECPETVEQLIEYLNTLQNIYQAGTNKLMPIAIDDSGRYYSASGKKGVIYNIEELVDCEERISSVANIFGTDSTDILFIYKLDEPVILEDTTILYCGYIKDFSIIIDRYHTDAFCGQSTVYLMNDSGIKLYTTDSENHTPVFVGRNIYSILEDMTYTHGNSYESCMEVLEETGNSIANASLNETEYYLCLHRMIDTDWVLLLVIPAQYVATNTQILVDSVVKTLLFAGFVLAVIFIIILVISMKMQQQEQLYRKEQENSAKLEVSRQEAEASKHAAEEAFKVAEAANNSKSSFLSNMSHDIRTPMNAIVGFAALLSRDADNPDKVREYTGKISSSSQHLLGLINDVLDMSRIESGKTTLNLSEESISDIVDGIDLMIRPQMNAKGHTFEIDIHKIVHDAIIVDKTRFNQICINLLSNAVKYTQDHGHVRFEISELSVSGRSARYQITVSDNGYGMSEEFQKHIFDSFSREEDSRTSRIQGTGLGMAITKNLVDLMGGTIRVESEKGVGSTFIMDISFQLSQSKDNAEFWEENCSSHDQAVDDESVGQDSILKGKHILVAEDNELNAEILSEFLEMAEATCDICEDGKLAVETFENSKFNQYDLVLMDVQMPVMNGYEATRAIRKCSHPRALTIPIIAMTANAFTEDIQESLKSGMNAHIAKPVNMSVLEETVKKVLK